MRGLRGLARRARLMVRAGNRQTQIAIKCPAPLKNKKAWGEYHFAKALAKALERLGFCVRIDLRPNWNVAQTRQEDVAIVLRGRIAYSPAAGQINICWLICHPDQVTDVELEQYDHVFVASTGYAETLATRLATLVTPLLQCSDPNIFHLPMERPSEAIDLLFVGNSRGVVRKIVADALSENLPIVIYGENWDGRIDPRVIRGRHIKNSELHVHYGSAKIVLNDHWPEMAANGFVSNRIFDAGLSGAFVISDNFVGAELLKDCIITYETPLELRQLCEHWLLNDAGRREVAMRLRNRVLSLHTFDHRARVIGQIIDALLATKGKNTSYAKPKGTNIHTNEPLIT